MNYVKKNYLPLDEILEVALLTGAEKVGAEAIDYHISLNKKTIYLLIMKKDYSIVNIFKIIRVSNHPKKRNTSRVQYIKYDAKNLYQEKLENAIAINGKWESITLDLLVALKTILSTSDCLDIRFSKRMKVSGRNVKGTFFYTVDREGNKTYLNEETSKAINRLINLGLVDFATNDQEEIYNRLYVPTFVKSMIEELEKEESLSGSDVYTPAFSNKY